VGQQAECDVAVPGILPPHLVVVETDLALGHGEALLHGRALLAHPNEFLHGRLLRTVGLVEPAVLGIVGASADQEPTSHALLALIFQLIGFVDGTGERGAVGLRPTLQAAAWCEYLETHATRLYSSAGNPAMERARALLDHIRKGEVRDGDATRSVYRKHWSKLSTPDEVKSSCSVLEDFGWTRLETVKTDGRSTTKVRLHPTLKKQA